MQRLDQDRADEVLGDKLLSGRAGLKLAMDLAGELGLSLQRVEAGLEKLEAADQAVLSDNRQYAVHRTVWDDLGKSIVDGLEAYHAEFPLKPGPNREELKNRCVRGLDATLYEHLLQRLEQEGRIAMEGAAVRTAGHSINFSADEEEIKGQIEAALKPADLADVPGAEELAQRLQVDKKQIDAMLRALQDLGQVVQLEGGLFLHSQTVGAVRAQLREELEKSGQITVAAFRDLIGSNRRYALALLSFFDAQGFTQRRDDVRVLQE